MTTEEPIESGVQERMNQEQADEAWGAHPDPMLADLANAAEIISVRITVLVPGAEIEGMMISGNKFSELTTEMIRAEQFPKTVPDELHESLRNLLEKAVQLDKISDLSEFERAFPPKFIHLQDATVRGNGYPVGMPGSLKNLRIPIDKISAWSLA